MSYAPSTLYRAILVNIVACHMPYIPFEKDTPVDIEKGNAVRAAVANESIHELRRFMDFHGGDVLRSTGKRFDDPLWSGHTEMQDFARIVGENCADSWDGEEFDYEPRVDALAAWLARNGFHDPAAVRL